MSNNRIDFSFNENTVTIFTLGDRIWFGSTGVAKSLGYKNPCSAVVKHCKHSRTFSRKELAEMGIHIGSPRGMVAIPEGDMYRLVTHSKLSSAQDFELKVYDEILPELRAKGKYTVTDELTSTMASISQEMKALRITTEAHNRLCSSKGTFSLTEASKMNQITQQELIELLGNWKWIYKRGKNTAWLPYSDKQKNGLIEARVLVIEHEGKRAFSVPQVRITARGLSEIAHNLSAALG